MLGCGVVVWCTCLLALSASLACPPPPFASRAGRPWTGLPLKTWTASQCSPSRVWPRQGWVVCCYSCWPPPPRVPGMRRTLPLLSGPPTAPWPPFTPCGCPPSSLPQPCPPPWHAPLHACRLGHPAHRPVWRAALGGGQPAGGAGRRDARARVELCEAHPGALNTLHCCCACAWLDGRCTGGGTSSTRAPYLLMQLWLRLPPCSCPRFLTPCFLNARRPSATRCPTTPRRSATWTAIRQSAAEPLPPRWRQRAPPAPRWTKSCLGG